MTIDPAKHKMILVKILKEIYSDPAIGPLLGFKGGTAANLFYGLDRFSVDLDFDLLDENRETAVYDGMNGILRKFGRIKTADHKRFGFTFILDYAEKDPGAQNVKVEVNRRNFGSRYVVRSYLGIPMKVMVPEDMTANKLVAFYERIGKTNRDLYDTWFFFANNWMVNQELVESRTGMPFADFLETCCHLLEKMDGRHILSGMGELLTGKQKNWVKTRLKEDLLFQLRLYLETSRKKE